MGKAQDREYQILCLPTEVCTKGLDLNHITDVTHTLTTPKRTVLTQESRIDRAGTIDGGTALEYYFSNLCLAAGAQEVRGAQDVQIKGHLAGPKGIQKGQVANGIHVLCCQQLG
jgi:hypothetical protein